MIWEYSPSLTVRHSFFFIIYTRVSWWLYCSASNYPFHSHEAFPPLLHRDVNKGHHIIDVDSGRDEDQSLMLNCTWKLCCSPCAGSQLTGPEVLWEPQRSWKGKVSSCSPKLVEQRSPHTRFSAQLLADVTWGHTDLLGWTLGTKDKVWRAGADKTMKRGGLCYTSSAFSCSSWALTQAGAD